MSVSNARLRVVLDTNVFLSGSIGLQGSSRRLLFAWYADDFDLVLSEQQYEELTDVFARPRILARIRVPLEELTRLRNAWTATERIGLSSNLLPMEVRDVKHKHLVTAALEGDADYLVSRDFDLLVLRNDLSLGKLKIVTVDEFLAVLGQ